MMGINAFDEFPLLIYLFSFLLLLVLGVKKVEITFKKRWSQEECSYGTV